jgi:hypothetical protein
VPRALSISLDGLMSLTRQGRDPGQNSMAGDNTHPQFSVRTYHARVTDGGGEPHL